MCSKAELGQPPKAPHSLEIKGGRGKDLCKSQLRVFSGIRAPFLLSLWPQPGQVILQGSLETAKCPALLA